MNFWNFRPAVNYKKNIDPIRPDPTRPNPCTSLIKWRKAAKSIAILL